MGVRPAIWVNFDGQKYKELKNEERIKQQQQIVIRESAAKSRVFDLATFSAKIESLHCVNEYPKNAKENEIATVQYGRYWLRDLNMTGSAESLNPNGRVTPVSRDYKQYKKVGVRPIVQVVY